ncbi:hypothetical protein LG634_11570 [Streptomyces bambusae]|uniref:hypothetical protein n=1 Tax=Streptomyces bambusae TaxID=1550616 RepID=UPI001CFC8DFC|nr:hypothetical protein [Streptomyces bambusae]MCB5165468.1 hypothetical protein [Streptomyces bambusae]
MRVARVFLATAAAVAAIGLAAPAALAGGAPVGGDGGGRGGNGGGGDGRGPRDITVNPLNVHQGARMDVTATGCRDGGEVESPDAFRDKKMSPGRISFATVRIFDEARPGRHTLTVRCHGSDVLGTHEFRVLPARGAQGGLGGSFGPSTAETAMGAGLVGVAALGAGVHVMRRRRSLRGRI